MLKIPLASGMVALALAGASWADTPSAPRPDYVTVQAVSVGAPERWDYLTLDPDASRLYLAHGDRLEVLDSRSGARLGSVMGIPGGTHGIGIVGALGKGYTDDGKAGEIVVFDLHTLQVLNRIKGEPDADGIVVDPRTQRVFVVNGDSGDVSVIDPRVDHAIGTIKVGGDLEFAVADGQGKVYVAGAERRELVRIDTGTQKVDARWPIPGCESAHGLAIDPVLRRLFVSCINQKLIVADAGSGEVIAELPIGRGTDAAAFDPVRQLVFSSNGVDGTISVIRQNSPRSYTPLQDIPTAVTGRTMTIDPASGRLFVAAAAIDPAAPLMPGPQGRPGRPRPLPDSLRVLYLDPQSTH